MCGFGNSEEVFAKLDAILLPLIEARDKPGEPIAEPDLPDLPHCWMKKDAMVGGFETGRLDVYGADGVGEGMKE
jgi:hypothetical protein